jgi:hypothetical protein
VACYSEAPSTADANVNFHGVEFFADKIDQFPAFAESQKQLMVKKWA